MDSLEVEVSKGGQLKTRFGRAAFGCQGWYGTPGSAEVGQDERGWWVAA
jgi:hypothetical protein